VETGLEERGLSGDKKDSYQGIASAMPNPSVLRKPLQGQTPVRKLPSAPEGVSEQHLAASLKRCPDTNLDSFRSL
jgi:hypothetical protein